MILYDKSGLFLGMGNQELYFLGYEDMEEFKNYHNDLAELFINKPGYIFKFKNFSWIDYTLHSGTPNKKVIVKTKNGKEVETALVIHEIFLDHTINGATICYCIELNNNALKSDFPHLTKNSAILTEPTHESIFEQVTKVADIPQDGFVIEDTVAQQPTIAFTEDYNLPVDEPIEFSAPNTISFETANSHNNIEQEVFPPKPLENESPYSVKLKIDRNILIPEDTTKQRTPKQDSLEYQSIDDITLNDLNFSTLEESYLEDANEDLLNDKNLLVQEMQYIPILLPKETEIFDLSESAEKLGLDISTIALIIGEYSDDLTSKMEAIQDSIDANQFHEANQEIVKLKSIAHTLNIPLLHDTFTVFQKSLEAGNQEEIERAFNTVQNSIMEFKEIIQ